MAAETDVGQVGGAAQQQRRVLCQPQPRLAGLHRQGDPRQQVDLSRRRDDAAALRLDALLAERPARRLANLDASEDGEVTGSSLFILSRVRENAILQMRNL